MSKGVEDDVFVTPKQNFRRRPTSAATSPKAYGRNREATTTHRQLQKEIKGIVQTEIKAMMRSLTRELLEQFGQEAQQMLQEIVSEAMKEMNRTVAAETATMATQAATTTAQSAQRIWANFAVAGAHRQVPTGSTGEQHMVIPARCNRETLIHPDLDTTLPSNNIPDETIEAINRMLQSSETVAIQRLKNGNIVITFKEKAMEYKKGDN